MTEQPRSPRHPAKRFADEDLIGAAKALHDVGIDIVYPGHPACPTLRGDKDEDWVPVAAGSQWAILTQDRDIKQSAAYVAPLRQHNTTAFILRDGDESTWENARIIARHWDTFTLKERQARAGRGAHLFDVHRRKVVPKKSSPRTGAGGTTATPSG